MSQIRTLIYTLVFVAATPLLAGDNASTPVNEERLDILMRRVINSSLEWDFATVWEKDDRTLLITYSTKRVVSTAPHRYKIWYRWDFEPASPHNDKRISHALMQSEIDCAEMSSRTLSMARYGLEGELLDHQTYDPNSDWTSSVPGSVGDNTLTAVCDALSKKASR